MGFLEYTDDLCLKWQHRDCICEEDVIEDYAAENYEGPKENLWLCLWNLTGIWNSFRFSGCNCKQVQNYCENRIARFHAGTFLKASFFGMQRL